MSFIFIGTCSNILTRKIYTYSKVKDQQILDKNQAYIFLLLLLSILRYENVKYVCLLCCLCYLDTSIQLLVKLFFSRPLTRVRTVQFQLY
jgi:hypothetical protein